MADWLEEPHGGALGWNQGGDILTFSDSSPQHCLLYIRDILRGASPSRLLPLDYITTATLPAAVPILKVFRFGFCLPSHRERFADCRFPPFILLTYIDVGFHMSRTTPPTQTTFMVTGFFCFTLFRYSLVHILSIPKYLVS